MTLADWSTMLAGEELAWRVLSALDPESVCCRTGAAFDGTAQAFQLKFFSQLIHVSLPDKVISSREREGEQLLQRLRNYADLAVLWYLLHASDIPSTGTLVNPADLTGGQIYQGGTHILPVQFVADKYGADREAFISTGKSLGAEELNLAEASLLIHPFPRVAVAILLWFRDDEFPARSVLLVDSSCQQQLPPDALWMTAMLCLTALL